MVEKRGSTSKGFPQPDMPRGEPVQPAEEGAVPEGVDPRSDTPEKMRQSVAPMGDDESGLTDLTKLRNQAAVLALGAGIKSVPAPVLKQRGGGNEFERAKTAAAETVRPRENGGADVRAAIAEAKVGDVSPSVGDIQIVARLEERIIERTVPPAAMAPSPAECKLPGVQPAPALPSPAETVRPLSKEVDFSLLQPVRATSDGRVWPALVPASSDERERDKPTAITKSDAVSREPSAGADVKWVRHEASPSSSDPPPPRRRPPSDPPMPPDHPIGSPKRIMLAAAVVLAFLAMVIGGVALWNKKGGDKQAATPAHNIEAIIAECASRYAERSSKYKGKPPDEVKAHCREILAKVSSRH